MTEKERKYLCLSMRHFHLEYSHNWRSMPHLSRSVVPDRLGECIYTLNTSNFKWPDGVTLPEIQSARIAVIEGMWAR